MSLSYFATCLRIGIIKNFADRIKSVIKEEIEKEKIKLTELKYENF